MSRKLLVVLAILFLLVVAPVSATIVGVRWNASNSSPSAITYIDINGNPAEKPNFNMVLPWSGMRRINISMTQYQTMVTVPKFWYNTSNYSIGANRYVEWWVSDTNVSSFKVHPAFISDGVELPSFLIGAFEGSVYNVTTSSYNTGDFAGVNYLSGGDKLSSVAGSKPTSGLNNTITLPSFRNLSQNRGTGWGLNNFNQISAIQLLYVIEYANLNSQSAIGVGVTQITDDGSTNMAVNTGFTAGVGTNATNFGNATGQAVITHYKTSQVTYPNTYRGVENPYGNIWKRIDGINIKADWNPWIADHDFASDTFAHPYSNTGMILSSSDGYSVSTGYSTGYDYTFLPLTVGGSSVTYLSDYYYQMAGNRSVTFGGAWYYLTSAGVFSLNIGNLATGVGRNTGARLAYTPNSSALTDANFTFTPVNSSFTQNITYGVTRQSVLFTDTSTGSSINNYYWSFNNTAGNKTEVLFSTSASPTITLNAGNWSINHTVSGIYDVDTSFSWVNISGLMYPSFTYSGVTGSLPINVSFTDTSTTDGYNSITAWNWSFGDGNLSTLQNPSHTYTTSGTYTVSLNVSNGYSYNTTSQTFSTPVSIFYPSEAQVLWFPGIVSWNATPTLADTCNWSFGDGSTSTSCNVSHQYTIPGSYPVALNVTNGSLYNINQTSVWLMI